MSRLSRLDVPPVPADAVRGLVDVGHGLADAFFAAAQRALRRLLSHVDLLSELPPAADGRFSRRLLFTDPVNRFGIWVLTWPPGWQTPIHNHHCACAFGVYRGSIEEILYTVDAGSDRAVESSRCVRDAGYVGGAPHEQGVVHEMLNRCREAAVSVHVYAYRPDHRDDSIDRCFARHPRAQEVHVR